MLKEGKNMNLDGTQGIHDILFIYLDQNLPVFSKTEKAIKSVLKKIPSLLSSVS